LWFAVSESGISKPVFFKGLQQQLSSKRFKVLDGKDKKELKSIETKAYDA
jgi:hypothetical protein